MSAQPPSPSSLTEALAARGVVRHFRKGSTLIQEGDLGETLFVIKTGRLRAFSADDKGKEITLGLYGPGDYVGEMALDGGPRSANVEALEPSTCSVVSRQLLRQFIAQEPEFAFELITRIIRRARLATESARTLALIDVYGRLTRLLDSLAVAQPDGTRILPTRITHQEIAHHIACSREMVSRLLKDLEGGGYLAMPKRQIVLLRPLPARW